MRAGGDTCAVRFWPASTFKVPHSLIALETGARTGPDDRETWDGSDVHPEACRADQTLATALRSSTQALTQAAQGLAYAGLVRPSR